MWRISLCLCLVMLCSPSAYAGGTSKELYDECHKLERASSDPKALMADIYCAGYIDGVVDGYRIMTDLHKNIREICLPKEGLSTQKVIEIFSAWLQKNPREGKTPARTGVLLSLKAVYGCK